MRGGEADAARGERCDGVTSAHDALANREGSGDPSAYTCAYFYRTNGATTGQSGVRQTTPEYYYCRGGGVAPQSAVTTMLKHLSKTSMPHFHATHHPIIQSLEHGEDWRWCYVDEMFLE